MNNSKSVSTVRYPNPIVGRHKNIIIIIDIVAITTVFRDGVPNPSRPEPSSAVYTILFINFLSKSKSKIKKVLVNITIIRRGILPKTFAKRTSSVGRTERNFFPQPTRAVRTLHDKLILLLPYSFGDRWLIVDGRQDGWDTSRRRHRARVRNRGDIVCSTRHYTYRTTRLPRRATVAQPSINNSNNDIVINHSD